MSDINQEIENMSKSMEVAATPPKRKSLEDVVLELGPEGIKKALPTLSENQRALLGEVIENMAKAKREEKLKKKQGVPEGADPETHERCVDEVKAQGHDKGSAFAICNAAGAGMKKGESPKTPEQGQVDVPDHMKKEQSGQSVPADATVPAPKTKEAKDKEVKTPMSGESQQTADEVKKGGPGSGQKGHQSTYSGPHKDMHSEFSSMSPEMKNDMKTAAGAAITASSLKSGPNNPVAHFNSNFKGALEAHESGDHAKFDQHAEAIKTHMKANPMQKAGATLQPEVDTTENGNMNDNLKKPQQDTTDEKAAKKAKDQGMDKVRAQGGVPVEGWEGQIIKGAEMSEDKAKDQIMAMEQKEHGTSDPKKVVEAEKKEHAEKNEDDKETSEKKDSMKKSLKAIMGRMIDRHLEKASCVSKLAKSLEVTEDKIGAIWDMMKAQYDSGLDVCPKNPEEKQSDMPKQMKNEGDSKSTAPMSGDSPANADEGEKPMQKGETPFYHEEVEVYEGRSDVFKSNRFGKNTHYDVDSYIEAEEAARKDRLSKSTFNYPVAEEVKKSEKSNVNDFIESKTDMDSEQLRSAHDVKNSKAEGAFLVKSFNDADMDELFGNQDMWVAEAAGAKLGKSNTTLEKAGEGSRGGKVMGHTQSGKPIYDNPSHEGHKNFTVQDHLDAQSAHDRKVRTLGEDAGRPGANSTVILAERNKHKKASTEHLKKVPMEHFTKSGEGSRGGKVMGHTKSGKPIYGESSHSAHSGFNQADHKDAERMHRQMSDAADTKAGVLGSPEGDKHFVQAEAHKTAAKDKRRSNLPQSSDFKDMGHSAHWDAADEHGKRAKEAVHPAEKQYHSHMQDFHGEMYSAKVKEHKVSGPYSKVMGSAYRGEKRKEASEHRKKAIGHFKAANEAIKPKSKSPAPTPPEYIQHENGVIGHNTKMK